MSLINKCRAFWRFEETASPSEDATGRGNSMTWYTAGNDDPAQGAGVLGYGINLNYSYLYRPYTDDLKCADTSFTFAGWIAPGSVLPSNMDPVISLPSNFMMYYISTNGTGYFQWTVLESGNILHTVNSGSVPNGEWCFVRCWLDIENNQIGIQVDCATPVTGAWSGTRVAPGEAGPEPWFTIGRDQAGSYPYATHRMDGWGLWHRVLDSTEADALCAGSEYPFGICGTILYGDYEFPKTFYPADDNLDWNIPSIKSARRHGAHSLAATLREKRLLVRGGLVTGPVGGVSVLRDSIDEVRTALGLQPQNLQFEPDRYWRNVRVEQFRNPYGPTHYCRIADAMEVLFFTDDPFQYAIAESTDTWTGPTTGATRAVAVGGNAPAQPEIAVTVGGSGAVSLAITLENQTTSESFTLTGDVTGGQIITIDTLAQTVQIGETDEIDLFDGQFLSLAADQDNTLEVTITGGTLMSIVLTWRNRWY